MMMKLPRKQRNNRTILQPPNSPTSQPSLALTPAKNFRCEFSFLRNQRKRKLLCRKPVDFHGVKSKVNEHAEPVMIPPRETRVALREA